MRMLVLQHATTVGLVNMQLKKLPLRVPFVHPGDGASARQQSVTHVKAASSFKMLGRMPLPTYPSPNASRVLREGTRLEVHRTAQDVLLGCMATLGAKTAN